MPDWIRPPSGDGPKVIIHSTTDLKGDAQSPGDPGAYVEARSVYLARPGDLVVGRGAAFREALAFHGARGLEVPRRHYHLSHDLLTARPPTLLGWSRFSVYALDDPTIALLRWILDRSGLPYLEVDANPPHLLTTWSDKTLLHPHVDDAADAATERDQAPVLRDHGVEVPVLPGYAVHDRAGLRRAARLLRERHGVTRGCLKPAQGSGGYGIRPGLDLTGDLPVPVNGPHVLEAHLDYLAAPSARLGAEGATLQLMRGTTCAGNVLVDADRHPGLTRAQYAAIGEVMARLPGELVTMGVDFGVGRVDGRAGGRVVLAVQDLNPTPTAADLTRAHALRHNARYAATRVLVPEGGLADLARYGEPIAAVPGKWGMIAATGDSPEEAVRAVMTGGRPRPRTTRAE
ncbi:hypothetical protein [Nonomuraea sp. NPDC050691]|uniref:hypothetical protein n=1 Tax=Nonomuraea sp. NPDC050691 TaxID=3155661 RepID=UPI0033C03051